MHRRSLAGSRRAMSDNNWGNFRRGLPVSLKEPDGKERLVGALQDRLRALDKENARHNAREILCLRAKIAHLKTDTGGAQVSCEADTSEAATEGHQFQHLPHRSAAGTSIVESAVCRPTSVNSSSNNERLQNDDIDICPQCKKDMKVHPAKGIMICSSCGVSKVFMDVTIKALPYNSTVDVTGFSYKRINHFEDWLLQIQAKESTNVPDEVIDMVREALLRGRAQNDLSDVTTRKVRDVLKSLRLNKMYEHVTQIACRITGNAPPRLSPDVEEKCRLMFMAIQAPFQKHCPPDRKNFLSYPYCLFKFLELLGCKHVLDSFILLKGKDKLQKQDMIFKEICRTLNWEFVRSI